MRDLRLIPPRFVPRIWGRHDLSPWYPARGDGEAIGEAWLSPPEGPVLVKLLFPEQALSVQVHPDDAYAAAHGLGRGKSEAWYVVEAAPGARLGVGLRPGVDVARLEAACRAGRGAECLNWIEVARGEVVNIPAGTVHAIGPGVVLLEVQQPSDATFRLDDYGRGRELHLDHGLRVARAATGAGKVAPRSEGAAGELLIGTEHFQLRRHRSDEGWRLAARDEKRWLLTLQENEVAPRGQLGELPPHAEFTSPPGLEWLEIRSGAV
jgi:mannose-6-phosphate isomerase